MAQKETDKTEPTGMTAKEAGKKARLENLCDRLPSLIGRDDPEAMALVKGTK